MQCMSESVRLRFSSTTFTAVWRSRRPNGNALEGEPRFLRAYFYFTLMRQYGPVPIVPDEGQDISLDYEELALPRATIDEMVDFMLFRSGTRSPHPAFGIRFDMGRTRHAGRRISLAGQDTALCRLASLQRQHRPVQRQGQRRPQPDSAGKGHPQMGAGGGSGQGGDRNGTLRTDNGKGYRDNGTSGTEYSRRRHSPKEPEASILLNPMRSSSTRDSRNAQQRIHLYATERRRRQLVRL